MSKINEVLMDIEVLSKLKLDIIKNGKIRQTDEKDINGYRMPFPCSEDASRVKDLHSVMNKYSYGWYIARESLEEQLKSLTEFEQYVLNTVQ